MPAALRGGFFALWPKRRRGAVFTEVLWVSCFKTLMKALTNDVSFRFIEKQC